MENLKTMEGFFLYTDWSLFHNFGFEKACRIDNIAFCVETILLKIRDISNFPNQKPHITLEVKVCINSKKLSFRNLNQVALVSAQLYHLLRKPRELHCSVNGDSLVIASDSKLVYYLEPQCWSFIYFPFISFFLNFV